MEKQLHSHVLDILLSESFKSKFKAMMREFDALQPDGDTPTSGYLSLNARQSLLVKYLGPFGFAPQTKVVNYPHGAVVETYLLIRLNGQMVPWIRRYGSASDSLRTDGDLAQAGISAWRKIFVAMGLSNIAEHEVTQKAENRADAITFINRKMSEMKISSITMLIGMLRSAVSTLDVTPQDVRSSQIHELSSVILHKIVAAINVYNEANVCLPAKSDDKDGF